VLCFSFNSQLFLAPFRVVRFVRRTIVIRLRVCLYVHNRVSGFRAAALCNNGTIISTISKVIIKRLQLGRTRLKIKKRVNCKDIEKWLKTSMGWVAFYFFFAPPRCLCHIPLPRSFAWLLSASPSGRRPPSRDGTEAPARRPSGPAGRSARWLILIRLRSSLIAPSGIDTGQRKFPSLRSGRHGSRMRRSAWGPRDPDPGAGRKDLRWPSEGKASIRPLFRKCSFFLKNRGC
jgi:hypothetical protein